jgi:hypothetical protein
MNEKRRTVTALEDRAPMPADVAMLRTRVPASLLRVIRQYASLDAKTLGDFIREAIEERLRSS